jgi:ATP-binding cassette, subfamily C, bacterial
MSNTLSSFLMCLITTARWRVAWAVTLSVLCSLTEGLALTLLIPTLQVAGPDLAHQGEIGRYAQTISTAFETVGLHPTLPLLLATFLLLSAGRALFGRVQTMAVFAAEEEFVLVLRDRLYSAIANAGWLFLCRRRSSDLVHVLTDEVSRVGQAAFVLLNLMAALITSAVYVAIALTLSWQTTLLVLASGTLLMVLLRGKTTAIQKHGAGLSAATNAFYASAIEHLQSLKTAKTYGAQDRNIGLFAAVNVDVTSAYLAMMRQQTAASAWFEVGSVIVLCALLYVSIDALHVPAAAILVLFVLFSRLMPTFMSSHQQYLNAVGGLSPFATVTDLMQKCLSAAEPVSDAAESLPFRHAVRFEQVSFAYRHDSPSAVSNLELTVPAGKVTAIVGASGAGKSTAADLIMGLLMPDSGRILIDQTALSARNARAWRQRIGYVGQETTLFHLTVRENLLWARPEASHDEMMEALRLAAADFVPALPQGLETVVGDRGILISQGERQRLALARALLRRPALLVLDEATNSLDSENEAKVLSAIDRMRGEQTVLIIAHRLSTIQWADFIYVVENGSVVESGTWQDLNGRRDGRFRALCDAQKLVA